uniref:Fibronectin type III domain-containing protein n=2 Tax=Candidatus Kentrum sp. SD TaxID=2126332 RepID=A0A451BM53_9GAMM|nr:MAG: Fibronectin type III domain-containing protein [Candidatus Kentron sp. SD]
MPTTLLLPIYGEEVNDYISNNQPKKDITMAEFPQEETKILELARRMIDGFRANPDLFPNPPGGPDKLEEELNDCEAAKGRIAEMQATLGKEVEGKNKFMNTIADTMHGDLRYSENTVDADDLKRIGWSGRHKPTPLAVPGQARELSIKEQGEGSLHLVWKKPTDGGKVANYRIERREAGASTWSLAETSIEREITSVGQERGKALEYCVVAMNKAGRGMESNVVMVIL